MLLGSIDILMSKNIRYKINIAGFLIKRCAICTSQLVRRDLFGSCDLSGIFFHQILDSLDTDPATLGRIEECMLMAGQRCNIFPHFQIFFQSFFYLRTKINDHLISTFSCDLDPVIFEIHILNIQSDTFRHTNSRTKEKSNNSKISVLCLFIIHMFLTSQSIPTMFNIIKKQSDFICIQADDTFVMDLGNINKN